MQFQAITTPSPKYELGADEDVLQSETTAGLSKQPCGKHEMPANSGIATEDPFEASRFWTVSLQPS